MAGVFPGRIDPRALPELTHHAHSAHRVAAVVAGTFVLVGLTWAFLTDVLLYSVSHDRVFMARVQTAKDWTFIGHLCIGYPEEEHDIPALQRADWERRHAPAGTILSR